MGEIERRDCDGEAPQSGMGFRNGGHRELLEIEIGLKKARVQVDRTDKNVLEIHSAT